MRYSLRALYKTDKSQYDKLTKKISPSVKNDIEEIKKFRDKYRGFLREISYFFNDKYLKANLQKHGTKSYGMMVNLLLAERKKSKDKI